MVAGAGEAIAASGSALTGDKRPVVLKHLQPKAAGSLPAAEGYFYSGRIDFLTPA
jgi:hypothetical protein